MPSPFPGMDPYLEDPSLWPMFHARLIVCLYETLLLALGGSYQPRIEHRLYNVLQSSVSEKHSETYLEILDWENEQLITLLDVVSPANKATAEGRQAYREQWRRAGEVGANRVEIDLVLQGQPTLDYSRDGLPDWDFAVTVTRSTQPERYEIYTATLQKRLPRFRIPLAPTDRDVVLDLNTAITQCYDQVGCSRFIDYGRELALSVTEEKRHWMDELLQSQRLRRRPPSHEAIALAAYYLWEQAGRPFGQDKEHWHKAEEQLRSE